MNSRIIKPKRMSEKDIKKLEEELRKHEGQFPELDDDSEEMKELLEKYYRGW